MLLDEQAVAHAVLDHIAAGTTDMGPSPWREPVANYLDADRLAVEQRMLSSRATVFCPSAALAEPGAFAARGALVVARGTDGRVRALRNACRHRGMEVARGTGCTKAFVCPYHGWTYGVDGHLRHVPHEDGFPDVDRDARGLVEVASTERNGLVFVAPDGRDAEPAFVNEIGDLIGPDLEYLGAREQIEPANWKILAATFLEGLHIRFLHRDTFFPLQYDNLNVVEHFGPNSRVTFPFRNIERLADRPVEQWSIGHRVTFVYHLFPNAIVATFPTQRLLFILEPLAVDETRMTTYAFSTDPSQTAPAGPDLLLDGGREDFDAARSVQRGLTSGANDFLEFGLFESAIRHFHVHLDEAVEACRP
jgi:phenylpropionate dioxygenase-like ring-hydroxylating dioxygenase large terminal subunit